MRILGREFRLACCCCPLTGVDVRGAFHLRQAALDQPLNLTLLEDLPEELSIDGLTRSVAAFRQDNMIRRQLIYVAAWEPEKRHVQPALFDELPFACDFVEVTQQSHLQHHDGVG